MRRTRFKPAIKQNTSFALNITSMTDMFTIMLVFLLQTFATAEVQIDPVNGVRLPSSRSEKNPVDGIKLSVSTSELKLDTRILASLKNSEFETSALDSKDANFIKPLFDELNKLNKLSSEHIKSGKILLQADKEIPYATLSKIMYTASQAGFPQLKLVAVVGE